MISRIQKMDEIMCLIHFYEVLNAEERPYTSAVMTPTAERR